MCVEVYQSIGESFSECVCLYRKADVMGAPPDPERPARLCQEPPCMLMRWRCVCWNGKQTVVGAAPEEEEEEEEEESNSGISVNRKQLITGNILTIK